MYCLNLMRIALELAQHNHVYEDIATKFFEHFLHIAEAMTNIGGEGIGLWDEDGRVLLRRAEPAGRRHDPAEGALDGRADPAVRGRDARAGAARASCRSSRARLEWFLELPARPRRAGVALARAGPRRAAPAVAAARPPHEALLQRMLDETEFLSDYGVRALSTVSRATSPTSSTTTAQTLDRALPAGRVRHRPVRRQLQLARADLVAGQLPDIESLQKFHHYYGDDFKVECPTGSGNFLTHRRGRRRAGAPADPALPARRARPAAGVRRPSASCRTIRTSATTCCSTSTSTATTAAASAPRTRPAGPAWSPSCCSRAAAEARANRKPRTPAMTHEIARMTCRRRS